ncbi:hypothetical protein PMAYCL1PPCAC_20217, partial [Pristionchus mayeri]
MMATTLDDGAPVTDNSIVGYRVPVECYKKGMPKDASGRVSLCTVCWTWRVLPDNYVPRYMNEALCDEDTSCLSGYATCTVVPREHKVMKNDSGVLTEVSISAANYCECKPIVS